MVCFIILHYMVYEETEKCVDSILKLKGDKKIIIVDNDSPNESYEELNKYYNTIKDVIILRNNENSGFARGNNIGYKYMKENLKDCSFAIVMNNDMEILQEDFINRIYEIYKRDQFYILGPDIYSTSQHKHQNPEKHSIRSIVQIERDLKDIKSKTKFKLYIKEALKKIPLLKRIVVFIKNRKKEENEEYKNIAYNVTLHGSCYIFSEKYIQARHEAFFSGTRFYCEAQILDYQCEKENWTRVYDPSIQVLHYEDVATNATYKSYIKKFLFQKKCLIESLEEFKKLIENDNIKKRS